MADSSRVVISWSAGRIELDAAPSQSPQFSADVTEHPVEDGASVADHVRRKSDSLAVDGILSDTPLAGTPEPGRALRLLGELERLIGSAELLTVTTVFGTRGNLTLASLSATPLGVGIRVSLSLKQIRIARSKWVAVEAVPRSARAKASTGMQPTEEAEPAQAAKSKSALKGITDGISGFFGGGK